MLKIRLQKFGKKNKSYYFIVLIKNSLRREGQIINKIGFYDPLKKLISINLIILKSAIEFGAYPTDTARYLIKKFIKNNFNYANKGM